MNAVPFKAHNWNCAWNVSCLHFLQWSYDSNTQKIMCQGWRENTLRICLAVFGRCAMSGIRKANTAPWVGSSVLFVSPSDATMLQAWEHAYRQSSAERKKAEAKAEIERMRKEESLEWQGRITHLHTFAYILLATSWWFFKMNMSVISAKLVIWDLNQLEPTCALTFTLMAFPWLHSLGDISSLRLLKGEASKAQIADQSFGCMDNVFQDIPMMFHTLDVSLCISMYSVSFASWLTKIWTGLALACDTFALEVDRGALPK